MSDGSNRDGAEAIVSKRDERRVIIIADDSPNYRAILKKFVTDEGYEVHECVDGCGVMKTLEQLLSEGANIAALILDVVMPEMGGIETLERVRSHSILSALPVVLITGTPDLKTIQAAKNLHVSGFFLKPLTAHKVTQKLADLIGTNERPTQIPGAGRVSAL